MSAFTPKRQALLTQQRCAKVLLIGVEGNTHKIHFYGRTSGGPVHVATVLWEEDGLYRASVPSAVVIARHLLRMGRLSYVYMESSPTVWSRHVSGQPFDEVTARGWTVDAHGVLRGMPLPQIVELRGWDAEHMYALAKPCSASLLTM